MDEVCFNCYLPGHLSIRCTHPSRFSRCFDCKRVCERPNQHYWGCSNKQFISRYIEQNNKLRSATQVAEWKFLTRFPLYVMNGPEPINISETFAPIQSNTNFGLLLGNSKHIEYYQWNPMIDRRCVINVVDVENVVRLSVRLLENVFYINKKIRVRESGSVEYRNGPVENQVSPAELTFKVDTLLKFRIAIYAFHQTFLFEVSQNEVKLISPEWTSLECSICYDTLYDRTVKLTPCGHMYCTHCILQSCNEKSECPLCRKAIRINDLRDIYLHN